MTGDGSEDLKKNGLKRRKILLALLPYWTPLIPPQGIASIKVFLEKYGYRVKTLDANVENQFKEIYQKYFNALKEYIPENHRGNFYNIGHDVLRNHLMAYFNRKGEQEYNELVKHLVFNTYFWTLDEQQIVHLNRLVELFYVHLEQYILEHLETEQPDVLGLATHLGTLGASMFSFKLAKERYPDILTVAGGTIFAGELPVTSPDFHLFLEKTKSYLDKVIVGEGNRPLLKLLEGELPESQRVYTLKDIGGEPMDVSTLDLPDVSDFELSHYPYMAAGTSFSCPHRCRFCNVTAFFGKYRKKSVKQVIEELKELYRRHGYQLYFMTDALLNPVITELADGLIKEDISIYMDSYLRVSDEVCDTEKTLLWRRGGLYRTRMGIETGSQRLLDLMKKGITVEQSRAALASLAYAGIKTTAYFVIGFPGETEADFQKTLDLLEETRNDIWEAESNPFYYYYTGQPQADKWADKRMLLYPGYAGDLLISQTWILDCEPSREERFRRLFRFTEHCKKLGIPNPYSSKEIHEADKRWKTLHENAVPALIEFDNNKDHINENKYVKKLILAQDIQQDDQDFMF
jgi:radical SAM superfamily enzyme YgiQ (UPF0313 family)